MGFIFKSKWKSLDIVDAGPDVNVEVDGMKCKKIIGKSYSEVGGWIFSKEVCAVPNTHSVHSCLLSPLFPYKASPWGSLTAWFWIYPSCLDNKAQSIVLLLYLLSESHENLRATLIRQQRGQGTSETRGAGNGGKGGQEGAGQTEVSFPKISRPGAVLVWGLR